MKKIIILAILFGSVANTAYAQLNTTIEGAATVETDIENTIEATTEIVNDIEVETETSANTNVESNTSIEANASLETETTNNENTQEENVSETEANTNTTASGISFSIKASGSSDVDTSIQTSAQVSNETELESYATVVVQESDAIEEVEAKQNELKVTYASKAKLFGFIPLTVKNEARVELSENANGAVESEVRVKFPWYQFLFTVENKAQETETKIKQTVDSAVQAHATIDAQVHAKALGAVEATIEGEASANIN